jgi:hypothetical protein
MNRTIDQHGRWRGTAAFATLLALLTVAVCAAVPSALGASGHHRHLGGPRPLHQAPGSTPFRDGDVLVAFHSGASAAKRAAIQRAVGASHAKRLGPAIKPAGHGRVRGQDYLAPFKLRVPSGQVLSAVARLRQFAAVAYAEPNYMMSASAAPVDPFFGLQWGDVNLGQPIPTQTIEETVGAPEAGTPGADDKALNAWQVTTGSRSVVVAVVDTGVDYTHPDLAANIWNNPGGVGGCPAGTHGYNAYAKTCDPLDQDETYAGHGTHVAGIVGAVGNNGVGIAGVAWQTTILPVKWMQNAAWGETSTLIESLQWLVSVKQEGVNVRVANDSDTFYGTAYSQALANEVDTLGANEILFVASGGNTGNNNDEVAVQRYPCSYDRPTEICVAPSDNKDQIPAWANYGPHTVDLAAPGVSILSSFKGGWYGYLSGSSMAAPQVAGTAALVASVAPAMSASALKTRILANVDQLPSMAGKVITGGRLNVCKAVPGCNPGAPINLAAPAISGTPRVNKTLTASPGSWSGQPTAYAYQWERCYYLSWLRTTKCYAVPGATGAKYTATYYDILAKLRVAVTATNASGHSSPASSPETASVGF